MAATVDLTNLHLNIVKEAVKQSASDHSQALVAVVFAAAAFEGWLASLVTHAKIHAENDRSASSAGEKAIADVLAELERTNAQWLLKLQVASALLQGKSIDRSAQPWQDVELLFKLRNSIVHPNLTWSPAVAADPKERHAIVKSLVSRGIVPEPEPLPGLPGSAEEGQQIHAPPTSVLLRPELAAWAVRTVISGLRAVAQLSPDSGFRTRMQWWVDTFLLGAPEALVRPTPNNP